MGQTWWRLRAKDVWARELSGGKPVELRNGRLTIWQARPANQRPITSRAKLTAGPGIQLPFFENEAAEAQWSYHHREEYAAHWIKAIREGYVGEGVVARYARKMREAEMAKQLPTQVPPASVEEHTSK